MSILRGAKRSCIVKASRFPICFVVGLALKQWKPNDSPMFFVYVYVVHFTSPCFVFDRCSLICCLRKQQKHSASNLHHPTCVSLAVRPRSSSLEYPRRRLRHPPSAILLRRAVLPILGSPPLPTAPTSPSRATMPPALPRRIPISHTALMELSSPSRKKGKHGFCCLGRGLSYSH